MSFCCVAFLFSPFLDDVLNSDLWVEKIANSDYILKVFDIITPTMTGNSQDGFNASCSGITNGYGYQCFDKNINSSIFNAKSNGGNKVEIICTFPTDYKLCALKTIGSTISNTDIIAMSSDMSFYYLENSSWIEFATGMNAIAAGSQNVVNPYYTDVLNMVEFRTTNRITNGIKVSYSLAYSQEHSYYMSMGMREIYVYGRSVP